MPTQIFASTLSIVLTLLGSRGNGLSCYLPAILGELNLFMEGSHKSQVSEEPCWEYLSQKELTWSLPLQWWWTIKYLSSAIFLSLLLCFFLVPLWGNLTLQAGHWQWQFSERNHLVPVKQCIQCKWETGSRLLNKSGHVFLNKSGRCASRRGWGNSSCSCLLHSF